MNRIQHQINLIAHSINRVTHDSVSALAWSGSIANTMMHLEEGTRPTKLDRHPPRFGHNEAEWTVNDWDQEGRKWKITLKMDGASFHIRYPRPKGANISYKDEAISRAEFRGMMMQSALENS